MNAPLACLGLLVFASSCAQTPSAIEPGFEALMLLPREATALGDLDALQEWQVLGEADFSVQASDTNPGPTGVVLTGHAENMRRNSFLVSRARYADFELLVSVRIEAGGNSGVQIRSHVDWEAQEGHGRLWGYQIEIDPSERAWSAGLYDEGRRGWLADLKENPEARAAFQVGEWNEYRILCEGPRIRSWVNGVPAVDFIDQGEHLDLEGHLAFQVHNGTRSHVEWRNPRIRTL